MKTIFIRSDERTKHHAEELEQLIKGINWQGAIKQFDYSKNFSLGQNDKVFIICPSRPNRGVAGITPTAMKDQKIIPVTYQHSNKENLPLMLKFTSGISISNDFPHSLSIDRLCNTVVQHIGCTESV